MLIRGGRVFTGEGFAEGLEVRVHNGFVREVGCDLASGLYESVVDLRGDWLLPGFVDVHIHGFGGHDTMRGEKDIRAMSRLLYREGVAAFCPTTMSAPPEETAAVIEAARQVMRQPEHHGAAVLGVHMEAPFLQPEKAGAQQASHFALPDTALLRRLTGGSGEGVCLITVAPELPGAEELIRTAAAMGIHVSLGHSSADAETAHRAADWGADHATHLFNAMPPLHHRRPGLAGAALSDGRIYCEMIADGVHLHGDIVRLIARCKGPQRCLCVTDAMEAAGMPEGRYSLGGQAVTVRGGEARLADGTLAGSVLTMRQALENLIHRFGIPPAEACAMCTATPADSVGAARAGRIMPGAPAPLTRWDSGWHMVDVLG